MVSAERSSAVVAESLCGTATGYAQLILHTVHLDYATEQVVHNGENYTTIETVRAQ